MASPAAATHPTELVLTFETTPLASPETYGHNISTVTKTTAACKRQGPYQGSFHQWRASGNDMLAFLVCKQIVDEATSVFHVSEYTYL